MISRQEILATIKKHVSSLDKRKEKDFRSLLPVGAFTEAIFESMLRASLKRKEETVQRGEKQGKVKTGFDFIQGFNVYDCKACKANEYGGTIFLERVQNATLKPPSIAAHFSEMLHVDYKYYLAFCDWQDGFQWYVFSVQGLRTAFRGVEPTKKGGFHALGHLIDSSRAQFVFDTMKTPMDLEWLQSEIKRLEEKYSHLLGEK